MIQNLLRNWKTSATGVTMIGGSVIHLIFAIKAGTANENTWTITLGAIVGGIGLMFAGDASQSKPADPAPPTDPTAGTPKP